MTEDGANMTKVSGETVTKDEASVAKAVASMTKAGARVTKEGGEVMTKDGASKPTPKGKEIMPKETLIFGQRSQRFRGPKQKWLWHVQEVQGNQQRNLQ